MFFWQTAIIAVSLSMDAFAAAICKGACMIEDSRKQRLTMAALFGVFQALMPIIGWFIGTRFQRHIAAFDHWIAFMLLAFIGSKMIYEVFTTNDACPGANAKVSFRELLLLAVATSIDALVVGVVFAIEKTPIALSALIIGVIAFALSLAGSLIGNKVGTRFRNEAQFASGLVLIGIGVKILLEHLSNM